jgi:hypothetical protein
MAEPIIWLHEDALRITHPVFKAAPADARVIHIWDDAYLQAAGYSLKRLVFIYETLCALPLDIIRGDMAAVFSDSNIGDMYVPSSINPTVQKIIAAVSPEKKVTVVTEEAFVTIAKPRDFTRFFQYWGKAEKSAFQHNSGTDA